MSCYTPKFIEVNGNLDALNSKSPKNYNIPAIFIIQINLKSSAHIVH